MAQRFADPTKMQLAKTLAQRFIPLADSLRDLCTKFGMRPYKLRVVRARWMGGRRGVGSPMIEQSLDILPTPLITDLSTLTEVVHPVGLDESGSILVTEISGRFTDNDLRLRGAQEPDDPAVEVFYEIEFPQPGGADSIKRRFYSRSAPHYNSGRLQWQLRLERAHPDRDMDGLL